MEASIIQKKKNSISKSKIKKTIKNVLARPDQIFWPEITEEDTKVLLQVLRKHKINIPEFKKPHWKELKLLPKDKRPKPPKLSKVDGLVFGINECVIALDNGECSAIIIEATVNPRTIVQSVIEKCTVANVPFLCLNNLRKATSNYFGIATSCLGIKCNCLMDVNKEIKNVAKRYPQHKHNLEPDVKNEVEKMDVEVLPIKKVVTPITNITNFEFLYRSDKKTRVFVPNSGGKLLKDKNKFIGQDFIELSESKPQKLDRNAYMKMVMKRISNNPNRAKNK